MEYIPANATSEVMAIPEIDNVQVKRAEIVIVGGGVAGLYCALRLADLGREVVVLEALKELGGKIQTVDLDGFPAEFGPMRFELATQPLLHQLCRDRLGDIAFVGFPRIATEHAEWPRYRLVDDEVNLDAQELLKLGVLRALREGDRRGADADAYLEGLTEQDYARFRTSKNHNGELLANQRFWNVMSDVLSYQAVLKIRDTGTFYHLIPENPSAIEWIIFWLRALKPSGRDLHTIKGGVVQLVHSLERELLSDGKPVSIVRNARVTSVGPAAERTRARVTYCDSQLRRASVDRAIDAEHVILALPQLPLRALSAQFPEYIRTDLEAVIGFPLVKIFFVTNKPWWTSTTPVQKNASMIPTREVHYSRRRLEPGERDDGHGMVMLYTDRPNTEYWNDYVVGEVHDFPELNSNQRLVQRFAKFLVADLQFEVLHRAERGPNSRALGQVRQLLPDLRFYLPDGLLQNLISRPKGPAFRQVLQTLADIANQTATPPAERQKLTTLLDKLLPGANVLALGAEHQIVASVVEYGIRDWGRPPFGAAAHVWRGRCHSWEITPELRAFGLENSEDERRIHICGEAFSDYQGFIEGALRSAEDALETLGVDATGPKAGGGGRI